jgi:hypothetical protein
MGLFDNIPFAGQLLHNFWKARPFKAQKHFLKILALSEVTVLEAEDAI